MPSVLGAASARDTQCKKTNEVKAFLKNRVSASITCRLSRICQSQVVVDEIRHSAVMVKQCQLEVWHVVNIHVLRGLAENLPLPIFDQTFFNRCCTGVMSEA
ncbi:hypothetical protein BBJ29_006412 [Phytophthora kernoviae]|uniref:Uncharacterized protein n=1 Tax=Phytophthora kernoviae TaxID=325452 RepID=A0A3F2RHE4_9STRA|nr:hypothetical protein BBP00_00007786 [Phytophthora kernoviae]RLN67432.1 hypothetical protein BBJ29_006412 [Phytophthora kernoviae]